MKLLRLLVLATSISLVIAGCANSSYTLNLSQVTNGNVPTLVDPVVYPAWTNVTGNIQFKQILIKLDNSQEELFDMVRFKPVAQPLKISLDITNPQTVTQWQKTLGASVVINASYFDENYKPTTRVIVNQKSAGHLLTGNTGLAQTIDGKTWQFSNAISNLDPAAQFAVQSYPVLIHASNITTLQGSVKVAKRTVLAQDEQGNLYFIVTEYGELSMAQLGTILKNGLDLQLTEALNLDGGSSTGITIVSDTVHYDTGSALVPAVLYLP